MGIMVYSLYWVMQDFVHQQYELSPRDLNAQVGETQIEAAGGMVQGLGVWGFGYRVGRFRVKL